MNAPAALAARSSSAVRSPDEDEEMSLGAMLELFDHEEEPSEAPWATAAPGLRAWTQQWVQRATAWGAGPEGAWRAW